MIIMTASIQCDKCFAMARMHKDRIAAADTWRKQGWQMAGGRTTCPLCCATHENSTYENTEAEACCTPETDVV